MELVQLQYFMEVCKEGSITAASRNLYITASALSQALKQLENEIGYPLFDRVNNRLRLNAYGKQLEPKATQLLRDYRQMINAMEDVSPQTPNIGICSDHTSTFRFFLPVIMTHFSEYAFHTRQMKSGEIKTALLDGAYDLGLCMESFEDDGRFCSIPFGEDHMYVTIPKSLPLASRTSLALKELRGLPFIAATPITGSLQKLIDLIHRECGANAAISILDDYAVFSRLVATSDAHISFVTNIGLNYYNSIPHRSIIPLTDPELTERIHVVYLKENESKVVPIIDWIYTQFAALTEPS